MSIRPNDMVIVPRPRTEMDTLCVVSILNKPDGDFDYVIGGYCCADCAKVVEYPKEFRRRLTKSEAKAYIANRPKPNYLCKACYIRKNPQFKGRFIAQIWT